MFIEFEAGKKFANPHKKLKYGESHNDFRDCGYVLEPNEVVIDIDISGDKNKGMSKEIILKMLEIEGIDTQLVETSRGYHLYFTYDGLKDDEKFASEARVHIGSLMFDVEYKTVRSNPNGITIKQNGVLRAITNYGKRMTLPDCFITNFATKKVLPPSEIVPFNGTFDYDLFYYCVKQLKDTGYLDSGDNYNNWNTFVAAIVTMVKEGRISDNQGKSICTLIDCGDESTHDKYARLKHESVIISYGYIVNVMKKHDIEKIAKVCVDNNWLGHWERGLTVDKYGKTAPTRTNVNLILENDPHLVGRFAYNEFTKQIEVIDDVPWKRVAGTYKWEDSDDQGLRVYLDGRYGISPKDAIDDVLSTVSYQRSFHPVKDYFNGLPEWDGVDRVESLFIDYMGVQDSELIRMQTKLFFQAVVARTFEAGCKWDYVVLFKSPQGYGKSSLCRKITPSVDWFTDSIESVEGKDAMQSLKGKLIVEFAELSAMSKKEAEKVKGFLTRQVDEYRPSYGRHTVTQPRQCVFIGSTNDEQPIKDETGGRRWWVMEATKKWFEQEKLIGEVNVDQLWAEAVNLYKQMKATKGILALPSHLEKQANAVQREYTSLGVYEGEIVDALDMGFIGDPNDKHIKLDRTCAKQLWVHALYRSLDTMKEVDVKRINAIIDSHKDYMKYTRTRFEGFGMVMVYERK